MNSMISVNCDSELTSSIESLTKIEFVDQEQVAFVRAGLQNADNLNLAQQVRNKILKTIQVWTDVLLDADIKMGEMLKDLPKVRGRSKRNCTIQVVCAFECSIPKGEVIEDLGLKKCQARRFEMLSENKELIEQIRAAEAREYNRFPTIQKILRCIREQKELQKQQETQEESGYHIDEETQRQMIEHSRAYGKFNNILLDAELLNADDQYWNALTGWYTDAPSLLVTDQQRLTGVFVKLRKFENFLGTFKSANIVPST